eukprot:m.115435 g.115435  ORF g.115435 m.115435 type:complete len:713 (-) comp28423_c0_seq1:448-2586(-)
MAETYSTKILGGFRGIDRYPQTRLSSLPNNNPRTNNWREVWRSNHQDRHKGKTYDFTGRTTTRKKSSRNRFPSYHGVLNRAKILNACATKNPDDVCAVRITEDEISTVVGEDLSKFRNLVHLDCSGNELFNLDDFDGLPKLELLELALNKISILAISNHSFQHLTLLDLSYNRINADTIPELGKLPKLRSLDLSGNDLTTLPSLADSSGFLWLSDLVLDKNKLHGTEPFTALCGLPQLTFLSLDHNNIRFIPLISVDGNVEDDNEGEPEMVPFAELRVLSLNNNRISEAADLMNASSFRRLQTLHFCDNPLATKTASIPLVLQVDLCERHGIELVRKATQAMRPAIDATTMITIQPLVLPKIKMGGGLATLAARPQRQYLEYTLERTATTALPLPPISPSPTPTADTRSGRGFFLTEIDALDTSNNHDDDLQGWVHAEDGDTDFASERDESSEHDYNDYTAAKDDRADDDDDEANYNRSTDGTATPVLRDMTTMADDDGVVNEDVDGGSIDAYQKMQAALEAVKNIKRKYSGLKNEVAENEQSIVNLTNDAMIAGDDESMESLDAWRIQTPKNPHMPMPPTPRSSSRKANKDAVLYFSEEHAAEELRQLGLPLLKTHQTASNETSLEQVRGDDDGVEMFSSTAVSVMKTHNMDTSEPDFGELFRDDDVVEDEIAVQPMPQSMSASIRALKFTLGRPLVFTTPSLDGTTKPTH